MDGIPSQELWEAQCNNLLSLLGIDGEDGAVKDYLAYSESNGEVNNIAQAGTANIYRSASGREIEIGTIAATYSCLANFCFRVPEIAPFSMNANLLDSVSRSY